MIVMTRNGKTIVVTGWQAWLAGALMFLAAMAILAGIAFLMFGIAVAITLVLLVVVPVAIGVAVLASVRER
jgi:hypothetical protein